MEQQSDLACSKLVELVHESYIDSFITDALNADQRASPVARALRTAVRKTVGAEMASEMGGGRFGRAKGHFTPSEPFLKEMRNNLAVSDDLTMQVLKTWSETHYELGATMVNHLADGHSMPVRYPDMDRKCFRGWWEYGEFIDEFHHFSDAYASLATTQATGLMLVYVTGLLIRPPEARSTAEVPSFFAQTFVQIGGTSSVAGGGGPRPGPSYSPSPEGSPGREDPGSGYGNAPPVGHVTAEGPASFDIAQAGAVVAPQVSRGSDRRQEGTMDPVIEDNTRIVDDSRSGEERGGAVSTVTEAALSDDMTQEAMRLASEELKNMDRDGSENEAGSSSAMEVSKPVFPMSSRSGPGVEIATIPDDDMEYTRYPSPLSGWLEHLLLLPDLHPAWNEFEEFMEEMKQAANGRRERTQRVLELRARIEQMQETYAEEIDALRIGSMVPDSQNGPKDLEEANDLLNALAGSLSEYRTHVQCAAPADTDFTALREHQKQQGELADRVYALFDRLMLMMRLTLDDPDERSVVLSETGESPGRRRRRRRRPKTSRKVTVQLEESREE